jgi:ABC-type multidrug transport system fused ATPase/permease subunit
LNYCLSLITLQILQNLSLTIKPGQTVALVGSSGCGKSTCIGLLQRFYDPLDGVIELDGCNIKLLNIKWLRNQCGVVGQEPVLFNCSIGENIGLGVDNLSVEEMHNAAKTAYAHDFIMQLPQGYETPAGERGAQLSGGQKQRIAIARALARNPPILLLDEATSALDFHSEKIVQAALERARQGRTTIIIAHRLSTIKAADLVVAIDNGKVKEIGTHADLMEREGLYYKLVMSQEDKEELDLNPESFLAEERELENQVEEEEESEFVQQALASSGGRISPAKTMAVRLRRSSVSQSRTRLLSESSLLDQDRCLSDTVKVSELVYCCM